MLLPLLAAQPQGWVCSVLLPTCPGTWTTWPSVPALGPEHSPVFTTLPWSLCLSPVLAPVLAPSHQDVWIRGSCVVMGFPRRCARGSQQVPRKLGWSVFTWVYTLRVSFLILLFLLHLLAPDSLRMKHIYSWAVWLSSVNAWFFSFIKFHDWILQGGEPEVTSCFLVTWPTPSQHVPASHTDVAFFRSSSFSQQEMGFPACNPGYLWACDFPKDRGGRCFLEKQKQILSSYGYFQFTQSFDFYICVSFPLMLETLMTVL